LREGLSQKNCATAVRTLPNLAFSQGFGGGKKTRGEGDGRCVLQMELLQQNVGTAGKTKVEQVLDISVNAEVGKTIGKILAAEVFISKSVHYSVVQILRNRQPTCFVLILK